MNIGEKLELANKLVFNTVVSVEELGQHDMIYIYHHLKVGASVTLSLDGTNVKGDLRFKVSFKNFVLGYVTIKRAYHQFYRVEDMVESEIIALRKQKFLPISGLDICLRATKMKLVS
jgi:hypothetical protein